MLIVENESSFGDRSVLACTVNVTKPEPYTTFTMCTENVTFDISGIEYDENTEDMAFVFEVIDYTHRRYVPERDADVRHSFFQRRRIYRTHTDEMTMPHKRQDERRGRICAPAAFLYPRRTRADNIHQFGSITGSAIGRVTPSICPP